MRLNDRHMTLLALIRRYGLATIETIHRRCFGEADLNAVAKVTSRLIRAGYLNKYPLRSPRCYYRLGPEAVRRFGGDPELCLPLGPQALPIAYAILQFCIYDGLERLNSEELGSAFPWLDRNDGTFYREKDGRLAVLKVDLGAAPEHIARRCRDIHRRLDSRPGFRALVAAGGFQMTVLTGSRSKSSAIAAAVDRDHWPFSFRLVVVPDLLDLMLRSCHAAARPGPERPE